MCDISMDSTNLHQLHEDELVGSTNNPEVSLPSPCFSVANNDHSWRNTSTFFMNNCNIHETCGEAPHHHHDSLNHPITQGLGFAWPNDHISISESTNHQHHQFIVDNIKEEQSPSTSSSHHHHHHHHHHHDSNFIKFSDMLSSSSSPTTSSSNNEMLPLKNTLLSPTYKNHMINSNNRLDLHHQTSAIIQPSVRQYQSINKGISTTFSQIFPSVNISNMSNNNMPSPLSSSSSSIDQMAANDVQGGFDLFATARLLSGESLYDHSTPSSSTHLLELFDGNPRFTVNHDLQQSNDLKLSNIPNNLSTFNNNGVPAESKNYIMEQKSTNPMASKKQRFESRPSCPPFKVRKEKLGDRIAALQQLVAPFGKTDTASVLMEAFGYIKFLQNQVETLSVPYMKQASRNNSNTQRVSENEYCDSEEQKITDLKSRGLCLVPLSCMSYLNITSDATSGGVWLPPTYNPAPGF